MWNYAVASMFIMTQKCSLYTWNNPNYFPANKKYHYHYLCSHNGLCCPVLGSAHIKKYYLYFIILFLMLGTLEHFLYLKISEIFTTYQKWVGKIVQPHSPSISVVEFTFVYCHSYKEICTVLVWLIWLWYWITSDN